jgi:hypothetical protein
MESFTSRLKSQIPQEIGKTGAMSSTPDANVEIMKSLNSLNREMGENEEIDEKWSEKYKRSIDCNNPKGFSQKAHCQGRKKREQNEDSPAKKQFMKDLKKDPDYIKSRDKESEFGVANVTTHDPFIKKTKFKRIGKEEPKEATGSGSAGGYSAPLFGDTNENEEYCDSCDRVKSQCVCGDTKKVEATEATGASSAGAYATPAAWAKSTKKKDWRGKSKTQIPGGKFVQVKKKCKKFPYCNQGDIKALNLTNEEVVDKVIHKLSQKYQIDEVTLKKIIIEEIKKY